MSIYLPSWYQSNLHQLLLPASSLNASSPPSFMFPALPSTEESGESLWPVGSVFSHPKEYFHETQTNNE